MIALPWKLVGTIRSTNLTVNSAGEVRIGMKFMAIGIKTVGGAESSYVIGLLPSGYIVELSIKDVSLNVPKEVRDLIAEEALST